MYIFVLKDKYRYLMSAVELYRKYTNPVELLMAHQLILQILIISLHIFQESYTLQVILFNKYV
jgi:hypothetical protein